MVFGIVLTPIMIVAGGGFLLALMIAQILIGLRKISFKGRLHLQVHKSVAWALLATALVHGFLGLVFATGLKPG